jgi:uncharacterized membrane protein
MIRTIYNLLETFHAYSYNWSHHYKGIINLTGLALSIAISIYVFYFSHKRKEKWIVASVLVLLTLLVVLVGILNKAIFAQDYLEYALIGSGAIFLMDAAYAFHATQKLKKWLAVVAFLVFLFSSIIFTYSFLLSELLPANVLINWGNLR